jgi:phenylpropionate dioxygenase-like ring-hydroxylating dioxygenase large terminal subunit
MMLSSPPSIDPQELEILPLERSETIPSRWYTDPAFDAFDREVIFARTWQHIGPASKLSDPGSQIVGQAGGNPVLAVKDQDGLARAFYNVCRHRGGPLATEDCTTKVLQCKYHGWTYRLDGSLRGTPKFNRTELFDKRDYGLVPVRLDFWNDLLFVNLSENGLPLDRLMKVIAERVGPNVIESKKFVRRIPYEVNANWKVYVDNYLEGYHLPYVHPELCNLLDYGNYVTETFEYVSLQHSPIQQKDNLYGSNDGPAFYFFVWPNFMINILPGRMQTNVVHPIASNKCLVLFDYYYDEIDSDHSRTRAENDIAYSDRIQKEDAEICEYVQRGLESRAYDKGRFSVECENGVHHFQSLLKQSYRQALGR